MQSDAKKFGPRKFLGVFNDGTPARFNVIRTLIHNGAVMPGLPGFVQKGDGIITCLICGKPLTDELCRARRIGPKCIRKWGPMPGREYVEQHAKSFAKYQRKQIKLNLQVAKFDDWLYVQGVV
jgi:hypothetical protein